MVGCSSKIENKELQCIGKNQCKQWVIFTGLYKAPKSTKNIESRMTFMDNGRFI